VGTSPIASLTDIYDTSLPGAPSALATFAHHTQLIWDVDPAAPPAALQPRVWHVTPIFRLQQVNVWSMTAGGGGSRMLVRSYTLNYYAPGSQSVGYERSLLQSVQMTGACPNVADTGSMQALALTCASVPVETFTYNSASAPSGWTTMSHQVAANSSFVDIDGDGYPDAVSADPSGSPNVPPQVALNNHGTGFAQTAGLPVLHTPGSSNLSYAWFASAMGNTGFAFGNMGLANGVEQRGLAVIHVAHDGDHGRTRNFKLAGVLRFQNFFDGLVGDLFFVTDDRGGRAELGGDVLHHLGVQGLVDGNEDAAHQQRGDQVFGADFKLLG